MQGIRAMDGEMQALRNFLNKEHSLLNSLKEIADPQGRFAERGREVSGVGAASSKSWDDSAEGITWNSNLQVESSPKVDRLQLIRREFFTKIVISAVLHASKNVEGCCATENCAQVGAQLATHTETISPSMETQPNRTFKPVCFEGV